MDFGGSGLVYGLVSAAVPPTQLQCLHQPNIPLDLTQRFPLLPEHQNLHHNLHPGYSPALLPVKPSFLSTLQLQNKYTTTPILDLVILGDPYCQSECWYCDFSGYTRF